MPQRERPARGAGYAVGDEIDRVRFGALKSGTPDKLRLIHAEKAICEIAMNVERRAPKALSDAGGDDVREWRNTLLEDQARDAIRVAYDVERSGNPEQLRLNLK